MKKIILLMIMTSVLYGGCGIKQETEVHNEKTKVIQEDPILSEEKTEESPLDEVVKIEVEENIDEETEETPLYYLHNNAVIKPIEEDTNNRVVLLTIDDAPEHYSVEMAELLKKEEINAIFFVNGHFILNEEGKNKLKKIHELGFEIGNHTMNHPNLKDLDPVEQEEQIIGLNDLIEEIIGERPRFFRAPFGVNTDTSKRVVEDEGMQWMNWSYGYDFQKGYMEKEALADIMVNTELLYPGANLLMHDRKFTLEALPTIIEGLRDKGYEFVDPKNIQ